MGWFSRNDSPNDVFMVRRWDRSRKWVFYESTNHFTSDWESSAELSIDAALDIAEIYGGEVVPRNAKSAAE